MSDCNNCGGEEWVCENHQDRGFGAASCGAGAPCPVCNPLHESGILNRAADRIRALPESYSGWNDHDELFDRGVAAGRREAIDALFIRSTQERN